MFSHHQKKADQAQDIGEIQRTWEKKLRDVANMDYLKASIMGITTNVFFTHAIQDRNKNHAKKFMNADELYEDFIISWESLRDQPAQTLRVISSGSALRVAGLYKRLPIGCKTPNWKKNNLEIDWLFRSG